MKGIVRVVSVILFLVIAIFFLMGKKGAAQVRIGADLSFVPRMEYIGVHYRDYGVPMSALDAIYANGFRVVRLRIWHSPVEPWQGTDSTLAFARRAVAAGFAILLDFHYSDSWADPGQQNKPAAWANLSFPVLADSLYAYTNAVMRRFRDAGALPAFVQIGNEINSGMLWDDGRVGGAWDTPVQWNHLSELLSSGIAAVRDSLPASHRPQIILHLAAGGDNATCRWFFDHLIAHGVNFDIIGLSYYPWWHGTLSSLQSNLNDLAARYGKDVQVVETAYPWTLDWCDNTNNIVGGTAQLLPDYPATPTGQTAFLRDLLTVINNVPNGRGTGLCYWEPAWLCAAGYGSAWENLALFDFSGNALPALAAFGTVPSSPQDVTIFADTVNVTLRWSTVAGTGVNYKVYRDTTAAGFFNHLIGMTTNTIFVDSNAARIAPHTKFYEVRAVSP
jgi:arabinogalactan endo-1,4-beta-galactosidase